MKTPRAGKMRNRVTYQTRVLGVANDLGEQKVSWTNVATVWAEVISMNGTELFRAMQVHAEATIQITVRYDIRYSPAGRFLIGSREVYPLSVNGDPLNRFQTCLCKEQVT